MLISPYWDDRLMLEDNEKPHILAIGDSWFWFPKNNLLNPIFNKIVRTCWAPAFAAAGLE